jgi:hypothetical protein
MTIEELRNVYNAQPFKPFVMHLADGRKIPVRHREFIAAAPSGRTVTVYQANDVSNIVDLLLVTDIEFEVAVRSRAQYLTNIRLRPLSVDEPPHFSVRILIP